MSAFFDRIKLKLQREEERVRVQFLSVFIILGVVSLFMTVINYFTGYPNLMKATGVFAIFCILDYLLYDLMNNLDFLVRIFFAVQLIALFTFFIVTGEPQGFSIYWIILLPAVAMLQYGLKRGSVLSIIMLLVVVYFFWIPDGRALLQYNYNNATLMRFPALYCASYAIGYFFEAMRAFNQDRLEKSREKFRKLSYTDALTNLGNEAAYIKLVSDLEEQIKLGKADFSVIVMDLNALKHTDDTYGHDYGCKLIVETGKRLPKIFTGSNLFHIGGDEFVAIVSSSNSQDLKPALQKFEEELAYDYLTYKGVNLVLSVAIGYATYQSGQKYGEVFQEADEKMYKNKQEQKKKYNISDR